MGYWKSGGKWVKRGGKWLKCSTCACGCDKCCPDTDHQLVKVEMNLTSCGPMTIYGSTDENGFAFELVQVHSYSGDSFVMSFNAKDEAGNCNWHEDDIGTALYHTTICSGSMEDFTDENVFCSVDVKPTGSNQWEITVAIGAGCCGNPINLFYATTTVDACPKDPVTLSNQLTCNGTGEGTWNASPETGFGSPNVTSGGSVTLTFCTNVYGEQQEDGGI